MRSKIKKILLILMAFIMLFQAPLTSVKVYADGTSDHQNSGSGDTGGSNASSRTYANYARQWSGYRFYLAGDGFSQASSVVDILFTTDKISQAAGHMYYNIRGQAPSSGGAHSTCMWSDTALPTPPYPIGDGGNGQAFKEWMLGPGGGNVLGGNTTGGNPYAGGQSPSNNTSTYNPNYPSAPPGYTGPMDNWMRIPVKDDYVGAATSNDIDLRMQQNMATIATNIAKSAIGDFLKRGFGFKSAGKSAYNYDSNKMYAEDEFVQEIALAGESSGGSDQNAVKLLNYLIQSNKMRVDGYVGSAGNIIDYMSENNLKLIVEPVYWLSPNNYSPPTDTGYRVYGSMYNVFQLWSQTNFSDTGGNCPQITSRVGSQCMTVGELVDFNGVQVSPGYGGSGSIRGQLSLMNSWVGIGMHIYDVNPSAGTHTWDYPLGDTPGKAPDPTPLPDMPGDDGGSIKKYNIAKYYEVRDENGEVIERYNFSRTNNPPLITIEDEVSFKVEDWHVTPDPKIPSDNDGSEYYPTKGSHPVSLENPSPTTITIVDPDTTLHVLLVKSDEEEEPEEPEPMTVDGKYKLTESQISKWYQTWEDSKDLEFVYGMQSVEGCDGHTREVEDTISWDAHVSDSGEFTPAGSTTTTYTEEYSCTSWSLIDNIIKVVKENSMVDAYKNYIAFGGQFESYVDPESGAVGERDSTGGTSVTLSGFNYKFVLYRGDDKLVLSYNDLPELENNAILQTLEYEKDLGSRKTRKKASYGGTMQIIFSDIVSMCDYVTTGQGNEGCVRTDETSPVEGTLDAEVAIEVYAGKKDGGTVDTSFESGTQRIPLSGYTNVQGRMAKGTQIAFYPIIAMTYETIGKHTPTKVGVIGEYVRAMIPNSYAEVAWNPASGDNIHITSQQWSLHKRAVNNGKSWNGKNQVLPGGAIYNLDTKGSEQEIVLNTYQPILAGDSMMSVLALDIDAEEYTEEKAELNHQEFVLEAIKTLESLSLVQWVNSDVNAGKAWEGSGANEVYAGASLHGMDTTSCSSDAKYYLKDDPSGTNVAANEADLDVDVVSQTSKYYRIHSDYKGNIYLAEADSAEAAMNTQGSVILTKDQGVDAAKSLGGRAGMLNKRTGIVTKYAAAIERNTGNDKNAPWATGDGHWYNEAWSGVIIKADTTKLKVGLSDPAIRSTILDPKLCPKNAGQSDLYSKAYVSQYKTAEQSSNGGGHEAGYIASFKGQEITMKDMDLLFTSKKFYIPNANVQDLN